MSELNALLLIVLIMVGFPAIGIYGVRFGCKICAGFVPSIKEAAIAIGLYCLAYIPLAVINAVPAIKTNWTAQILLLVVSLCLSAFVLGAKLKHPEDGSIGFKKGGLVSLVWGGFGLIAVLVVTAVVSGIFMLYGALFSTSKPNGFQPAPQAQEAAQSGQAAQSLTKEQEQQEFFRAAQEIIARFPQLDVESPNRNQSAIDFVVRARDGYIANGHAIDIALRMAANDYADALQRQAQHKYVQPESTERNRGGPPARNYSGPTQREQREGRPKCNIQPVMTDAEIAACR